MTDARRKPAIGATREGSVRRSGKPRQGASQKTCCRLMDAATTDACIDILKQAGLHQEVLSRILREAGKNLRDRAGTSCQTGMIMFSRIHGRLGCTPGTEDLLKSWYS